MGSVGVDAFSQQPGRTVALLDGKAWAMTDGTTEFNDDGLDLIEMAALRAELPGAREWS